MNKPKILRLGVSLAFLKNHIVRCVRVFAATLLCLFGAAMLLLAKPAHAVDGIDFPGSDYADFDASSSLVCENTCMGDSDCHAWTWAKPGFKGPTGRCYLKSKVPQQVANKFCESGSRENATSHKLPAEDKTDRPGSDYKDFEASSWDECEAACGQDNGCKAWSYARAGYQGPTGRCWLKSLRSRRVPYPVDNEQTVSGVKFSELSHSL